MMYEFIDLMNKKIEMVLNELIARVEKEFGVEADEPRFIGCGNNCLRLKVQGVQLDAIKLVILKNDDLRVIRPNGEKTYSLNEKEAMCTDIINFLKAFKSGISPKN